MLRDVGGDQGGTDKRFDEKVFRDNSEDASPRHRQETVTTKKRKRNVTESIRSDTYGKTQVAGRRKILSALSDREPKSTWLSLPRELNEVWDILTHEKRFRLLGGRWTPEPVSPDPVREGLEKTNGPGMRLEMDVERNREPFKGDFENSRKVYLKKNQKTRRIEKNVHNVLEENCLEYSKTVPGAC